MNKPTSKLRFSAVTVRQLTATLSDEQLAAVAGGTITTTGPGPSPVPTTRPLPFPTTTRPPPVTLNCPSVAAGAC